MLILAIGLGLPSFLSLLEGAVPGTTAAFAASTAGTSVAMAGMGMAFQNYGSVEALLCIVLSGIVSMGVMWLVPRMRGMTLMPLASIAFLLFYHSTI